MSIVPATPATVKPLQQNAGEPFGPACSACKFPAGTPIPFIWGAQDAASGLDCVPEMHFIRYADQVNYAAGWASIKGHNLTTRWFLEVK
jgi:hypothetical protein